MHFYLGSMDLNWYSGIFVEIGTMETQEKNIIYLRVDMYFFFLSQIQDWKCQMLLADHTRIMMKKVTLRSREKTVLYVYAPVVNPCIDYDALVRARILANFRSRIPIAP